MKDEQEAEPSWSSQTAVRKCLDVQKNAVLLQTVHLKHPLFAEYSKDKCKKENPGTDGTSCA